MPRSSGLEFIPPLRLGWAGKVLSELDDPDDQIGGPGAPQERGVQSTRRPIPLDADLDPGRFVALERGFFTTLQANPVGSA